MAKKVTKKVTKKEKNGVPLGSHGGGKWQLTVSINLDSITYLRFIRSPRGSYLFANLIEKILPVS